MEEGKKIMPYDSMACSTKIAAERYKKVNSFSLGSISLALVYMKGIYSFLQPKKIFRIIDLNRI